MACGCKGSTPTVQTTTVQTNLPQPTPQPIQVIGTSVRPTVQPSK